MAVHSKSYQKGYSVGFVIGELIGKTIKFFFSLLWDGIVKASLKCKAMLIAYILLTLFAVASYLINQTCTFPVSLILITATVAGIFIKIEEFPQKQRLKAIYKMFEEINLKASDDSYPQFLYENVVSDYASVLAFESMIPVSAWESKQELIEIHLNVKIINIKQDKDNNRITYVVTQTKPLPTKIEWYTEYMSRYDELMIGMGYAGIVSLDLNRYAHALVSGETGSGKSNLLKCLIFQAIQKNYDTVLIDFKRGVSFSDFSDLITVYYDHFSAKNVLEGLVKETETRLDLFRNARVDNLIDYNKVSTNKLQRKIVFIDELAELLKVNDKELSKNLYSSIETLARLSRSAGIHLILGIQRPDSTIISGQIKNNVSYRICGRFVDPEPSRIVLNGHDDACELPNVKGRVIVSDDGRQEVQCFYYRNKLQYNQSVSGEMQVQSAELKEEIQEKDLETVDNLNFDFSDI